MSTSNYSLRPVLVQVLTRHRGRDRRRARAARRTTPSAPRGQFRQPAIRTERALVRDSDYVACVPADPRPAGRASTVELDEADELSLSRADGATTLYRRRRRRAARHHPAAGGWPAMPEASTAQPSTAPAFTVIDFDALGAYERYKLMASLIVPRPIALVTTVSQDGVVNAAPFSMFAMVGEDPPLVMISVNRLGRRGPEGHRGQHRRRRASSSSTSRTSRWPSRCTLRDALPGATSTSWRAGRAHRACRRDVVGRPTHRRGAGRLRVHARRAAGHRQPAHLLRPHPPPARARRASSTRRPGACGCRTTPRSAGSAPASTPPPATASPSPPTTQAQPGRVTEIDEF